jgi:tRNA A37 threonylcarbamoyladenosine dehydratase
MAAKNKKTPKKIDILELSDAERTRIIKQIKQRLQKSMNEAKLWRTLLQYEELKINGQVVFSSNNPLEGLSVSLEH